MKKKLTLLTLLAILIFNKIDTQDNQDFSDQPKPNQPRIIHPLPPEAYQEVFELLNPGFKQADTKFLMFLQNRYKNNKEQKNIANEDKLIDVLFENFMNNRKLIPNKKLDPKIAAECSFAAGIQSLFFHQLIAETKLYPNNYLLAPFEQSYNFELYPVSFNEFAFLKSSLPAVKTIFYKQTVIRNWAKFLLIALSRR